MENDKQEKAVTILEIKCPLCDNRVRGLNKKSVRAKHREHLKECKVKELLEVFPRDMKLGDIYHLLIGKYPKGYKPEEQ